MSKNRKPGFYCPVSPHIAWSWGLIFQDCPVVPNERDSEECRSCPLRGAIVSKDRNKPKKDMSDKHKKSVVKAADGTPEKVTPSQAKTG